MPVFHELVLDAGQEEEKILVDPDGLFELLGELSIHLTEKFDDAQQHFVWTKFPMETGNEE